MPAWLVALLPKLKMVPWDKVPWKKLWMAAQWLFRGGKRWIDRNLTVDERQELAFLMTTSKGKRSNLTLKQQKRFTELVRKAVFGTGATGSLKTRAKRTPKVSST